VSGLPNSNGSSSSSAPSSDSNDSAPEPDIKVILLGDSAVGKSKLVERFLMNDYVPRQLSTFALTVYRYKSKVDGRGIEVDFWDTAGQERFSSMHPGYYHRAHACVLVFDVTRKITYQNLAVWYKELQSYRPGVPILVVANKIDVDYNVVKKTFNFPQKHAHCFPTIYFCSAADGTNVVKLFNDAIRAAWKYKENPPDEDFTEAVLREVEYFEKKEKKDKENEQHTNDTTAHKSTSSTAVSDKKE